MEEYRTSILEYDSVKNAISYSSEKAMEKGIKTGMEKGIKTGMEKGLKKGRLEGREEERREMIQQFLKAGMPIELLSKYINLTVEQIENILKN